MRVRLQDEDDSAAQAMAVSYNARPCEITLRPGRRHIITPRCVSMVGQKLNHIDVRHVWPRKSRHDASEAPPMTKKRRGGESDIEHLGGVLAVLTAYSRL